MADGFSFSQLNQVTEQVALAQGKEAMLGHYVTKSEGKHESDAFWNSFSGRVFMTASRKSFFQTFFERLQWLDRPKSDPKRLHGRGACTVIVAPKGSGKSTLLGAAVRAGAAFAQRTLFCHVNYRLSANCTPVEVFKAEAPKAVPQLGRLLPHVQDSVAGLDQFLENCDLRVVFLVDEVEDVFGMPLQTGEPIIKQLLAIGELDGPRTMFAYVTGSSSKVRRLCFAKLLPAEMSLCPSYNSLRDFNGRKYGTCVLEPISTRPELDGALECMGIDLGGFAEHLRSDDDGTDAPGDPSIASPSQHDLDAAARWLFVHSRGIAQAIDDLANPSQDTLVEGFANAKRNDRRLRFLWRALVLAIEEKLGGETQLASHVDLLDRNPFSAAWPLPAVAPHALDKWTGGTNLADIWNWSDSGYLLVAVNSIKDTEPLSVSFIHVSDFIWAAKNIILSEREGDVVSYQHPGRRQQLSPEESDYFRHPAGTSGHEKLFAEALAYGLQDPRFTYRGRVCALKKSSVATSDVSADDNAMWTGEIFKGKPDEWGTDLIAFIDKGLDPEGRRMILIWRAQCKTSADPETAIYPKSGTHNVQKIISRFRQDFDEVLDFISSGKPVQFHFEVINCLVTTCRMTPGVETELQRNSIRVFKRGDLARMWTPRILSFLGSEEKLKFMTETQ